MGRLPDFQLQNWIEGNKDSAEVILAGSLGTGMTLEELRDISNDPRATVEAVKLDGLKLGMGTGSYGSELPRKRVAALYDQSKMDVGIDDVVLANATTGANLLVLQGLLSKGDHVVCQYPIYGALLEIPQQIGCDMSCWEMDPDNGWKASLEDLKSLLKPTTKMLILNNPHNPTGSVLGTSTLKSIIDIAREHNIIVFEDEIFRPLFQVEPPSSIVELGYDRTIATGSLSKAWGFSGIRLGWVVTKDKELQDTMIALRNWIIESVSFADEIIGSEVLSERCSNNIVQKNIGYARENLAALRPFLQTHKRSISCALPEGAATAFVKFTDPSSGQPVDDVEFCTALMKEAGVLLSPGSMCFGPLQQGDFKGHARLHTTAPPERFKEGLGRIAQFLTSDTFAKLGSNGTSTSNGTVG